MTTAQVRSAIVNGAQDTRRVNSRLGREHVVTHRTPAARAYMLWEVFKITAAE